MRFSIIISVYQTAAHVGACVQSVLDQEFAGFEIILVDDGSIDNSWQVCQSLSRQDQRIRAYRQQHQGPSAARNLGLSHASGDYLTFFDSDDTVTPHTLGKADELVAAHHAGLLIFSINHCTMLPGETTRRPWLLTDEVYRSGTDFIADLVRGKRLLLYSCANKFYRRDILQRHNIQFQTGTHFGEDRLFNFQYLPHAETILTCSHLGYNYFSRPIPSLSQRYRPEHGRELLALHQSKRRLIDALIAPSIDSASFLATDLYFELQAALRHLSRHWLKLSPREKQRELRALTALDYPDYLWPLARRSLKTRLTLFLIRHRLNFILRVLIGAAARLTARRQAASATRIP